MDRRLAALTLLAGMAWLTGCTGTGQPGPVGIADRVRAGGVLEVAQGAGASAFVQSVAVAGLEEELSGSGPYTLFVPTDAAFRAAGVSPGGDGEALRRLIGYHVVPGQVGTSFMRGMEMGHLTSSGETLSIDGRSQTVRINGASLLQQDLVAGNGVVHVIDRVLTAN